MNAGALGRAFRGLVRTAGPARKFFLALVPRALRERYHRFAVRLEFESPRPALSRSPGVNLIGYLSSASGVGESARAMRLAAEAGGIACASVDLAPDGEPGTSTPIPRAEADLNPLDTNLFCVNPEGMKALREGLGGEFFAGRRNVGYWYWEMPELPPEWRDRFEGLDEVWVASRFVAAAVKKAAPAGVAVRVVPPPIPARSSPLTRRELGLPEDRFLFLTMADARGYLPRKNPIGAIEAFRQAFAGAAETALVVRLHHPEFDPEGAARLRKAADQPGIILLEGEFSRERISGLLLRCDAFVSLHRSEGFGFPLAEALALGKPAIATDYSGPRDYLNFDTGFPVDFRTRSLERAVGPYSAGAIWAEPDLGGAARALRQVFEHRAEANRRGSAAAAFMEENFSSAAAGERLAAALDRLRRRPGA